MDKLIALDKELLIYLNNLGSEFFDPFWLFITKQFNLIPLFLFVFYLIWKKIGWKNFGIVIVFLALIILVCDQTTNLFKYTFQRLRPLNDPDVIDHIRMVYERKTKSFSFFSGHASNSMAATMFIYLILRKYYKYAFLLFLFPLFFAYSRIYLALHFPIDIIVGYTFGVIFALIFRWIYLRVMNKVDSKKTV